MKFCVGGHVTRQPLYICNKVDKLYFSRKACIETKILPETFPYPMDWHSPAVASLKEEQSADPNAIPPRPDKIPYAPTPENIP